LAFLEAQHREKSAREQWMSTCMARNHQLEVAKILARQAPTDAARLLYARSDLVAFLEPGFDMRWIISLCTQIKVDEVVWSPISTSISSHLDIYIPTITSGEPAFTL
jgi:hypothetical protein